MKHKTRKLLSILLALFMFVGILPVNALADNSTPEFATTEIANEETENHRALSGAGFKLNATVENTGANGTWTWDSSNKDVATVDNNGNVTIVSAGNTTITAKYESDTTAGESAITLTVSSTGPVEVSTWAALDAALKAGGDIILTADVIPDNPFWADALTVSSGVTATLDLNGHIIDRGYRESGWDGSVIKIYGILTLIDSNPTATHEKPVTYTDSITGQPVTIKGGIITGGFPDQCGGGVQIQGGTLNMKGGSIACNSVGENNYGAVTALGGGVHMNSGTFNMEGGAICGNKAISKNTMTKETMGQGGGVYVNNGTFTLSGGTISGNIAGDLGGGVYIASTYSGHRPKLVRGSVTVTGNALLNGASNNVYLEEGGKINIDDTLSGTIGVTMQTPGTFTDGLSGHGTAENFTSDNEDYIVFITDDGEAQLLKKTNCTVIITAGANMTKTAESGAASQTVQYGNAMTTVVYQANEGYYFPETYDLASVNGVVVTRKNHTQITVSGKPKADANIALSDAVAKTIVIFDANGGKVNGLYTDTATTDTDGKLTSLPVPVRTNYRFDGWFTEKTGGKMVNEDYVFSESITIYAHWTHIGGGGGGVSTGVSTYNIEIEQPENGSLSASHTTAPGGTKITVTVTPDESFEIDTVKVTDRNGKEIAMTKNDDGTYSFTMPNDSVNVTASFKEKAHDCPSAKFTDVDKNAWYHEYIDYVVEKGLMQGIQDNLFAPNVTTSRAMIVTILYRLEGQPVVTGENPFDDVPIGVWYDSAVMWANANGIVEGYGNGKFGPKDLITREQFAAIMYRYANFKGYDTSKTADLFAYEDVFDISDWAVPAMKWANAEDFITGRTATTLAPRGNATRAEAAAILMRFIENAK